VAEWIELSDASAMIRNIDENEKTKMIIPSEYCSEGIQSKKNGMKIKTNVWLPESLEFIDSIMQSYGHKFVV